MYANFYDKKDKCLFSVKIDSESDGYKRATHAYARNSKVVDWTITEKAMSKKIIA
jgi:hypothetical protein